MECRLSRIMYLKVWTADLVVRMPHCIHKSGNRFHKFPVLYNILFTSFGSHCLFATVFFVLTFILLMWRIGRAPNSIPIYSYIQQHAKSHSLFISGNCSTCYGWYFHPSSGAHTTVSTASGICHTVAAICRYHGRVGTDLRCCRYSCMRSWWWVEVPLKTCRAISRYK
jgi:hypothetical protein